MYTIFQYELPNYFYSDFAKIPKIRFFFRLSKFHSHFDQIRHEWVILTPAFEALTIYKMINLFFWRPWYGSLGLLSPTFEATLIAIMSIITHTWWISFSIISTVYHIWGFHKSGDALYLWFLSWDKNLNFISYDSVHINLNINRLI